jgi:hypothetical protein
MAKSKGALILIAGLIGALFCLSGIVFTLQGLGIVGPSASFMFRSQSWIDNGLGVLVAGLVILGLALFFRSRTKTIPTPLPSSQQSPSSDQKTEGSA